jgi:hypothetical protein
LYKTLGFATICGDEQGVSSITVSEDEIITSTIPEDLQEVVSQLNDYFKEEPVLIVNSILKAPISKEFGLLDIPFGKQELRTSQDFLRRCRVSSIVNKTNEPCISVKSLFPQPTSSSKLLVYYSNIKTIMVIHLNNNPGLKILNLRRKVRILNRNFWSHRLKTLWGTKNAIPARMGMTIEF